jgi:hypothetical protein
MMATIVSGIPATAIARAAPAETDVDSERLAFNADRSAEFLSATCGEARRRRKEPVLRSSDNTKCGNRFHDLKDYSMEDR